MPETVQVETEDGLQLEALWAPATEGEGLADLDACLLVHGTGSHMAASGVLETFAAQTIEAGTSVLRINTRGHGKDTRIPAGEGTRLGGAAHEVISDCRYDLLAWLNWLSDQDCRRVALVGHSMGAVKCILSTAVDAPEIVTRIIAINPPRFSFLAFVNHPDGPQFLSDYQKAQDLIATDRGLDLVDVKFPLPMKLTAEGFVDKYGLHDEYDFVRYLPFVKCPLLILLGTKSIESSMAFYTTPDVLRPVCEKQSNLQLELIEGADTPFTGCEDEPFKRAFP